MKKNLEKPKAKILQSLLFYESWQSVLFGHSSANDLYAYKVEDYHGGEFGNYMSEEDAIVERHYRLANEGWYISTVSN